ncbi:MAG: hypothetical protein KJP07_23770, partial [Desulfatitalea sp.]|nr:hypothetical protein [Desulfatitalea sp.]
TGRFPDASVSVNDWLNQFTTDRRVHQTIGVFCVALFGTNIYEFPMSQLILCILKANVKQTGPPSSVFMEILFSSDDPLIPEPGVLWPLGAKQVLCMIPLTLTAPDLAPPGKHITNAYAGIMAPPFDTDPKTVLDASIQEFYDLIPGAKEKSEILHCGCWQKDWPVFRDVSVCVEQKTPVKNLYNVGDGVRIPGYSGSTPCAETARVVVEEISATLQPGK